MVIVAPDEVKTKAPPSTGRKEIWTDTAVVLVVGLRDALADASTDGLWLQVSALLFEWEVLSGGRRLLVLGDGASWVRTWFESLGIDPKAMIVCWWHLRKRCSECLSLAGGPKDRRRALEKALLDRLWEGEVDEAIALLREATGWVRNLKALEDLIGSLEKRRAYIPDYGERQRAGLWIAQHARGEVPRLGGVGALQAPRDELVVPRGRGAGGAGSGAGERRTRRLAEVGGSARAAVARPGTEGGLRHQSRAPTGGRQAIFQILHGQ